MSESLREVLDIGVFWEFRDVLLRGLAVNFYVFIAAAAVALGVGLAAALLRVNRFRVFRWIGTVHVEIFRNAPDYVMIVWVHFATWLALAGERDGNGDPVPAHVEREFRRYLECGILASASPGRGVGNTGTTS